MLENIAKPEKAHVLLLDLILSRDTRDARLYTSKRVNALVQDVANGQLDVSTRNVRRLTSNVSGEVQLLVNALHVTANSKIEVKNANNEDVVAKNLFVTENNALLETQDVSGLERRCANDLEHTIAIGNKLEELEDKRYVVTERPTCANTLELSTPDLQNLFVHL